MKINNKITATLLTVGFYTVGVIIPALNHLYTVGVTGLFLRPPSYGKGCVVMCIMMLGLLFIVLVSMLYNGSIKFEYEIKLPKWKRSTFDNEQQRKDFEEWKRTRDNEKRI